jgi:hypothetical protein
MPALRLFDVPDAERFVARIVSRSGLELSFHDRQDIEQFLLVEAWQLSIEYQPGIIRGGFACFATVALKRKLIDWQRKRWGRTVWKFKHRTYERPRPQFVEFDDSVSDRLDAAESMRAGDSAPGGDEDWRGLLDERDRYRIRDYKLLGLEPPQRAA